MFRSAASAGSSRLIVDGILALAVGSLILAFPGATAMTAILLVAGWSFVNGVTDLSAGVALARAGGRSWPLAVSGVASLATSILVVALPGLTIGGIVTLVGLWQVAAGALAVAAAWRARETLPGTPLALAAGGLRAAIGVVFVAMPAIGVQITLAIVAIDVLLVGIVSLAAGLRVRSAVRAHDAEVETLVAAIEAAHGRTATA